MSGRSSWRGTPVFCSIRMQNGPETPFLDFTSQYETCDCVVPIISASWTCPSAMAMARFSAALPPFSLSKLCPAESVVIGRINYRKIGTSQEKYRNLCLSFGTNFSVAFRL